MLPQTLEVDPGHVLAIDEHRAVARKIEALQHVDLPRAGVSVRRSGHSQGIHSPNSSPLTTLRAHLPPDPTHLTQRLRTTPRARTSVDLPLPLGPTNAIVLPDGIFSEMPSKTFERHRVSRRRKGLEREMGRKEGDNKVPRRWGATDT